ncbi:cytochrome aa3 quinol oxidase subunit IV [Ectobacillus polymachus]|uniref:cytochrome aa3 quinol oxidase subunit IV n=1 Tax=Ectobacillus polymachus TaxID=1508806 RepID=UPI003A8587A2
MEQNTHQNHTGFPWSHVLGFIFSLVLTFGAMYVALYTSLPLATILTVIISLAIVQALIQLVMFMHISEGEGITQKITILFSFFVALATVVLTVWIFFTMGQ